MKTTPTVDALEEVLISAKEEIKKALAQIAKCIDDGRAEDRHVYGPIARDTASSNPEHAPINEVPIKDTLMSEAFVAPLDKHLQSKTHHAHQVPDNNSLESVAYAAGSPRIRAVGELKSPDVSCEALIRVALRILMS